VRDHRARADVVDCDEALELLKSGPKGIQEWNTRRKKGEEIPSLGQADLREADLVKANLSRADLSRADLREAKLLEADLSRADLREAKLLEADLSEAFLYGADLSGADLSGADLSGADLSGANLREAKLVEADLRGADLRGAKLVEADLRGADLRVAKLVEADLSEAVLGGADVTSCWCWRTRFDAVDLSEVKGLETITHTGPSTVGVDTLIKSKGKIPEAFLRGCGVHESMIQYLPLIIGSMQPIQFYSCFISYSHKDEEFATRLQSRMTQEKMRVWFAPEDMKRGRELYAQIDEAIRVYDKLMIVLSDHSIQSQWVLTEIRRARRAEREEGRRKLFPIRLMSFEALQGWVCIDPDNGQDIAWEIRKLFIPDFSRWKERDLFEAEFALLLRDLKAEGPPAK
jgi:uncharacterized protein YjbI with pentapeptide repeats